MLDIINFVLGLVLIFLLLSQNARYVKRSELQSTMEPIRDAMAKLAAKVEDDFTFVEATDQRTRSTLASLSLQLVALAKACGYELRDGFWAKIVAKKPAAKAAPKKGVTK